MSEFIDDELGVITIKRNPLSRSIRMRLSARGEIVVSAPKRTPVAFIKQAVRGSRKELLAMQQQSRPDIYVDAQAIGQSHTLAIVTSDMSQEIQVKRRERILVATIPSDVEASSTEVQARIREQVVPILRKEAKAYLPKRLATLAHRHGYSYESVRFPHATSRWGSCSSSGTISLNIALMKLPLELIDYVIVHELAHTIYMNHSKDFWHEVEKLDPDYTLHRAQLKTYSPIV